MASLGWKGLKHILKLNKFPAQNPTGNAGTKNQFLIPERGKRHFPLKTYRLLLVSPFFSGYGWPLPGVKRPEGAPSAAV
jgi:hypothetical protein